MYSYIVTIAKVNPDSVEFLETGTLLSNPALQNAKVGEKYKLFTIEKALDYGVGKSIVKVEKVNDAH